MKTIRVGLLLVAFGVALAGLGADLFTVNVGTAPNDGTGDAMRTAFQKLNSNDVMLAASKAEATNASGVVFTLATNQVVSALTNHVADFGQRYSVVFATNDLNFVHSTNRAEGQWASAVFKVYAGPTNRQVWLNPAWVSLGSTTNYFVLASNKVAVVSLGQDGASETNVTVVAVVQP
jgi:hypothetical protein